MSLPDGGYTPGERPALVGVIHLEALPGSPANSLPLADIEALALRDAVAWKEGGADAVLVENFGDAPFWPGSVPPETVAFAATIARSVRLETALPLGLNLLRNDGVGALAAASASGGSFVRVNVLTHAFLTDQGVIEGIAHTLLRRRRALDASVSIWADLLVKHATPLAPLSPERTARDLVDRGGADAIIVTGEATGEQADAAAVARIASLELGVPLIVGSGVTPESIESYSASADGYIVGTWCKTGGRIDKNRVRLLADRIHRSES